MRIVFLGPTRSSFANADIRTLQAKHDVVALNSVLGHGLRGVLALLWFTVRAVVQLVTADVLYCWFADYHTLIPSIVARILRKRVIIVAGGYDIGYEPQIQFGARMRPIRWFCVRWTFRLAHVVLPVSEYAKRQLTRLVPSVTATIMVLYNAVKTDILTEEEARAQRMPMTLMISQGDSDVELKRKGVDVFLAVAAATPDIEFRLIGLAAGTQIAQHAAATISNLHLYPGFVSFDEVIRPSLHQAAAYLQPSIEEAFGVAIVEAMACGCIPVVAPVAAIPEVVGDVGRYCTSIDGYQEALRQAVAATPDERSAARARAMEFTEAVRAEHLLRIISSINEATS